MYITIYVCILFILQSTYTMYIVYIYYKNVYMYMSVSSIVIVNICMRFLCKIVGYNKYIKQCKKYTQYHTHSNYMYYQSMYSIILH